MFNRGKARQDIVFKEQDFEALEFQNYLTPFPSQNDARGAAKSGGFRCELVRLKSLFRQPPDFCRPFRTHGVVGILFPWADAIAKLFRHFVAAVFVFGRAGVEMIFHYLSHMTNVVLVQEVVVPQRDNLD